jgi:CDP-diacylglycerol--serine O-phosphatidyltransferase
MVSRLPTLSLKKIRVQHHQVVPTLLGIGIFAALFTTAPWPVLSVLGIVYLCTIPVTILSYQRLKRAYETGAAQPAAPSAEASPPYRPQTGEEEQPVTRH